jgi:ATP-dependent DNA helicase RecQ
LNAQEREERQSAFKNDEIQIIVATIAFGMGIDKPNVRFVVHLNLPKNMESYYQETGRAGRDGEESEAVLFYKSADFSLLAGFFNDEAEDQKNLLLNKLRRMGDFADAYTCRRKILLQYFNETRASNACGKCDNCDAPQRTWDGTETAQKLLSTLARLPFDYGLAHSVSILRGSKAKKVTAAQQQLSTYGIGKEHNQSAWMEIGKQLIQMGFIEQSIGQYPVIRLNDRSWQVLRGHERVELVQFEARPDAPSDAASRSKSTRGRQASSESGTASAAIKGTPLFEKLRTKRLELAQNLGVPAFVILSDKTLVALCEALPTDSSSLLDVHGFGKVKITRFGEDFLDVIRSHT